MPKTRCAFPKNHEHRFSSTPLGPRWNETSHEFAVERGPGHVAFALDGTVTLNVSGPNVSFWNAAAWYLILNSALGGGWPGNVTNQTVLPAYHRIEYVRVSRPASTGRTTPH